MKNDGRKLLILGIIAITIAITTTSVSLFVYHDSGDIYLDRSRPGFLPDEDELEEQDIQEEEYKFSDNETEITEDELNEYLLKLDEETKKLDAVPNPFSLESISDENLLNISE